MEGRQQSITLSVLGCDGKEGSVKAAVQVTNGAARLGPGGEVDAAALHDCPLVDTTSERGDLAFRVR